MLANYNTSFSADSRDCGATAGKIQDCFRIVCDQGRMKLPKGKSRNIHRVANRFKMKKRPSRSANLDETSSLDEWSKKRRNTNEERTHELCSQITFYSTILKGLETLEVLGWLVFWKEKVGKAIGLQIGLSARLNGSLPMLIVLPVIMGVASSV